MGRIQTNIGLITGVPITQTVDQLMALTARPKDLLQERTTKLESEHLAVVDLTATLASIEVITKRLGTDEVYDQRSASSSNENILSLQQTGNPPAGSFQYRPVQTVQNQQLLSDGFAANDEPLGEGEISFRFGPNVERSIELDLLDGGEGFDRGSIRITDRSGASAEIDLSTATSLDDVLDTINQNSSINVTAEVDGDRIQLNDNTGQSASNLKVEEVSGTTAASLGLDGIDVAADSANGEDIVSLTEDLRLDDINEGAGIRTNRAMADIQFELRDGTTGEIDLSPILDGTSTVDEELTLGDVMDAINAVEPNKLRAEIAPDGDRLILTDLSTDTGGTFSVSALNGSQALADMGLDGTAVDDVITGDRLLGGLKSALLDSLNGGQGFGDLGLIDLTDRNGDSDTIDLSNAETLEDVLDTINAASVDITAQLNDAKNGINLIDSSGATTSNMIVADGDATETATKLGLTIDDAVESVQSGDLNLQVVSERTQLDDLNGGGGVERGTFTIVESTGNKIKIDLSDTDIETVGDLLSEINRVALDSVAELNQTGDGILIRNTSTTTGTIQVQEGSSTTAADLHLLGSAVDVEIEGETFKAVDGSSTFRVEIDADDTLDDLRTKINELGAGVTAAAFNDGSNTPYRLSLTSDQSGKAGEMTFDTSGAGFSMSETVEARDALLLVGETSEPGSGILVTSSSNTFDGLMEGVSLEIHQASNSAVSVNVGQSDAQLVGAVEMLVTKYNEFREKLTDAMAYDSETGKSGLLLGDSTARRLDQDLGRFLSDRFGSYSDKFQTLGQFGIELEEDGKLSFDKGKLQTQFASDPEAVSKFFTDEDKGMATKFTTLIDKLSGIENSLLSNRLDTLNSKVRQNYERIGRMETRFSKQRERMFRRFYQMEIAVAKMQDSLNAISAIQGIPPVTSGGGLSLS